MTDDMKHHEYNFIWPAGLFDADDVSWSDIMRLDSEHALLFDDRPKTFKRRWQAAKKAMSEASCLAKPFAFIRGFWRGPDPLIAYWEMDRNGKMHVGHIALSDVEISYD